MNLPVIDTYAFPVILPSTQTSIPMRPFLVREEKLLLMAQESKNIDEQNEAVAQVIRNCTNNQVDPNVAPYFDIEYLLLQLRIRSVGEMSTPVYRCNHVMIKDQDPCNNEMIIPINLTEVKVAGVEQSQTPTTIKISPKYTLILRYPTIYTIGTLLSAIVDGKELFMKSCKGLVDLLDTLYDNDTQTSYDIKTQSVEEKIAFLESLTPMQYNEIIDFLVNMPTVSHTVSHVCDKCQFTHQITFTGLSDFLA